MLMEAVRGRADFVPQFVCNPAFDDLDRVAAHVEAEGVTSVRMLPGVHNYPFREWVVWAVAGLALRHGYSPVAAGGARSGWALCTP